ncbi:uncharacterized protein LOC128956999 [Oppia nitens]|uniref:uncharacterized protein LOC128956999 n=1 Tax=Oppia nitens TaxID=1686743 RepID=UPI0023DA81F4|nr:uncharacterized protein LOC128956999 [Oppia nitens]
MSIVCALKRVKCCDQQNVNQFSIIVLNQRDTNQLYIGRDIECHYRITSIEISRKHALIERSTDNTWTISDLKSTNGLFVNAVQLVSHNPYRLTKGDRVSFGPPQQSQFCYQFVDNLHPERAHLSGATAFELASVPVIPIVTRIQTLTGGSSLTTTNTLRFDIDANQSRTISLTTSMPTTRSGIKYSLSTSSPTPKMSLVTSAVSSGSLGISGGHKRREIVSHRSVTPPTAATPRGRGERQQHIEHDYSMSAQSTDHRNTGRHSRHHSGSVIIGSGRKSRSGVTHLRFKDSTGVHNKNIGTTITTGNTKVAKVSEVERKRFDKELKRLEKSKKSLEERKESELMKIKSKEESLRKKQKELDRKQRLLERKVRLAREKDAEIRRIKAELKSKEKQLAAVAASTASSTAEKSKSRQHSTDNNTKSANTRVNKRHRSDDTRKPVMEEDIVDITDDLPPPSPPKVVTAASDCLVMTAATTVDDDTGFESEITCSICHEYFIQAVNLNCSHTFCLACIEEWKTTGGQQTGGSGSGPMCPICRDEIVNQNRELVLDNLIDRFVGKRRPKLVEHRKRLAEERRKRLAEMKSSLPPPPQPSLTSGSQHHATNNNRAIPRLGLSGLGASVHLFLRNHFGSGSDDSDSDMNIIDLNFTNDFVNSSSSSSSSSGSSDEDSSSSSSSAESTSLADLTFNSGVRRNDIGYNDSSDSDDDDNDAASLSDLHIATDSDSSLSTLSSLSSGDSSDDDSSSSDSDSSDDSSDDDNDSDNDNNNDNNSSDDNEEDMNSDSDDNNGNSSDGEDEEDDDM